MITEEIRSLLSEQQDPSYRDFQAKIVSTVPKEKILGIRTPVLRKLAKELSKREDISGFLEALPHTYFEENQLHAFILSEMKDYESCVSEIVRFLPYVDNWATCDQMNPKCFKKHPLKLLEKIQSWIASDEIYTIRFGIKMLMDHFLEENFTPDYAEMVAEVTSEEYYVKMMAAWYFATALAKQYDAVIPFIENQRLEVWTHNKAIQKAVESFRITPEQKVYLKTLKRK